MGAERGELAAARVEAAGRRAEQLHERMIRLRAGEAVTREDVERARAAALAQRDESVRAQQRLLHTYAAAANLRRGSTTEPAPGETGPPTEATRQSTAREPGTVTPSPHAPGAASSRSGSSSTPASNVHDSEVQRLQAENRLLRNSLVTIASVSGDGGAGWSRERSQGLWQALVDQCGQESWQGWARALCVTVTSIVAGVRGAAISGYDDRRAPHLLAVTDEWTRQVEEVHQLVGEGPAVEAYTTQAPVVVRRLWDEHGRWPGYVAAAADTDLSGVCALPITSNGVCIGSLTLYRGDEAEAVGEDWQNVAYLAAVAAKAVLADLDALEDGSYPWHVGDHGIQVAVGMLSVQLDLDVDEALAILRAFAFSNARGLTQVADAIVDGSLRLT